MIYVHAEGTVNVVYVVYGVDGTVGIFMTAAEHGLEKLPVEGKISV